MDGDGEISTREFKIVMKRSNKLCCKKIQCLNLNDISYHHIFRWTKMSDTEIEDILRKGDKNKDGYLTNSRLCIAC